MDRAFPFGLPGSTALYLCLYIGTLAVHAVLIGYVLAGSGYVALTSLWPGRSRDAVRPLLVDWLPFVLGAAITAGVAPLLFLQVLYKESFYTANLLLFHRWMAVVPVLTLGFYALYLAKTERVATWPPVLRRAIAMVAFGCFAFVAYSWTENHLLALDRSSWVPFYGDGERFYTGSSVAPRFGMWLALAAPLMAVVVGWQLWGAAIAETDDRDRASRRLALIALGGLAVAGALGFVVFRALAPGEREAVSSSFARPYAVLAALGVLSQLIAWAAMLRAGRVARLWLGVALAGVLEMVVGGAVMRESIRLARLGEPGLFELHERASESGGMAIFLLFLVVNTAVIAWCLRITRRGLRS
jgi:hypothetical protein